MARSRFNGWFFKAPRVPFGPFTMNFGKHGLSSVSFRVKHGKQSASWTIWSRDRATGLSSLNGPGILNYQRNMPGKNSSRRHDEEGSLEMGATLGAFFGFLLKGALCIAALFACTILALMADLI